MTVSASGAAPAEGAFSITPGASALTKTTRALYVGVTGNVNLTTEKGETVLFKNVPVGILPIQVTHVLATNTTASEIIGLY